MATKANQALPIPLLKAAEWNALKRAYQAGTDGLIGLPKGQDGLSLRIWQNLANWGLIKINESHITISPLGQTMCERYQDYYGELYQPKPVS